MPPEENLKNAALENDHESARLDSTLSADIRQQENAARDFSRNENGVFNNSAHACFLFGSSGA